MHDYSLAGHPKEKIFYFLAFIAIAVTPWVAQFMAPIIETRLGVTAAWGQALINAIPTSSLFYCIFLVFDKYLWKVRAFRSAFLFPDLNGTWECTGRTIAQNGNEEVRDWGATVTIKQSWSKILITLDRPGSSGSVSISASLHNHRAIGPRLVYQYENEVRLSPTDRDMRNHHGTTDLTFNSDCTEANGSYYTDSQRGTVGTMTLRRTNA